MSRQALSSLFAVLCSNFSPVMGCKFGSIPMPWQIPLIRLAVMLRISLCRIEGNPPLEQLSAYSMEKCWPQTQWEGICGGRQPYRRHKASLNAPLCSANPCSEIGRAESQLEAPFSEQKIRALYRLIGRFPSDRLLYSPHSVWETFLRLFSALFALPSLQVVYCALFGWIRNAKSTKAIELVVPTFPFQCC